MIKKQWILNNECAKAYHTSIMQSPRLIRGLLRRCMCCIGGYIHCNCLWKSIVQEIITITNKVHLG